jgi:hypothetical protein
MPKGVYIRTEFHSKRISEGFGGILRSKESFTCNQCNKEFIWKSNPNQKYCSLRCAQEARKGVSFLSEEGRDSLRKKATKHIKEPRSCLECGTDFIWKTHFDQKFCSRSCSCKYHWKQGDNIERCKKIASALSLDTFDLYPSEFNDKLKSKIRFRDGNICQICDKTAEQELQEHRKRLPIHHIDYDKWNCAEENLVTLCSSCHNRTNYNREYWKSFFLVLV